jgi:hypothetical protein
MIGPVAQALPLSHSPYRFMNGHTFPDLLDFRGRKAHSPREFHVSQRPIDS